VSLCVVFYLWRRIKPIDGSQTHEQAEGGASCGHTDCYRPGMRAVRCHAGRISVEDVATPTGDGIRVRVRSAGICGSDLHMIDGGWAIASTPGHEIAGELPDGTAVAIEPLIGCGECAECLRGDYNLCPTQLQRFLGIALPGGMQEELVVPEHCIIPLDEAVRVEDASLVEPLAVAVHGLRMAGLVPSMRVAVIGGGAIGQCAIAAITHVGAEVSLHARHDAQRAAGERLGATEIEGHYDLVVDCAGSKSGLETACNIVRPGGTMALLASYWDGFEPPGMALSMKEIRIVPSFMYGRSADGRDVDAAAVVLASNPEIPRAIITHRLPLDAAVEAFALARDRKSGVIKVVLSP
jgi:threonine dehydrogenase-like Zn-dependent dehydrogenase